MDRSQINNRGLVTQVAQLVLATVIIGGLLYVWNRLFKSSTSDADGNKSEYAEMEVLESKIMEADE